MLPSQNRTTGTQRDPSAQIDDLKKISACSTFSKSDAWMWVLDALVEELSTLPLAPKNELMKRLVSRAGYELEPEAAALMPGHNDRVYLVKALAGRVGAGN